MAAWWESLGVIGRIFAFIAIPSTLILIVQTILLFFGIGASHDADGGFDGGYDSVDADIDASGADGIDAADADDGSESDSHDGGVALFSVRGIVAMLCIGGWSGVVLTGTGINTTLSVILSIIFGTAALVGMFYLMKAAMTLQSSGNIDLGNAIGKTGRVYIPIPAGGNGRGKISITVQETLIEVDAITMSDRKLATGETVRVVSTDETGLLVVEPLIPAKNIETR